MTGAEVAILGAGGFIGNRALEILHLGGRHLVRPVVRRPEALALASRFDLQGRIADARDEAAPPTAFARGLCLGTRLALNDVDDTTLLAGAVVDLENGSVAGRLEASRRVTDFLTLEIKRHLVISDQSIAELSDQIGFDEPTNFIKFFKKHTGQTPAQFRKNLSSNS